MNMVESKSWNVFNLKLVLFSLFILFFTICNGQTDSVAISKRNCNQSDIVELFKKNKVNDTLKVKKEKNYALILVPVISSTPATGLMIGLAGQVAFKGKEADARYSLVSANLNYTTKGQTMFMVKNNVYLKQNRIFISGDWKLMLFSQNTYGLGTNAPEGDTKAMYDLNGWSTDNDSNAQPMNFNFIKLHQAASFLVKENFYVGGGIHFDYYFKIEDQLLDTLNGILTSHYTYSKNNNIDIEKYKTVGLTGDFVYDTRDNLVNPYKGIFANVKFKFDSKYFGSDVNATFLSAEFRYYHPMSTLQERNILGFWMYSEFDVSGSSPYMILPAIGYDQRSRSGRGYVQGRFRGHGLVYGETEFRFNISPCTKILGGVVFANVTTTSSNDDNVKIFEYLKPAVGAGLRIMADKKSRTNFQIDIGIGRKSSGVYFGATETF